MMTREEVIKLQSPEFNQFNPVDYFGVPLVVDGDYGPRTRWWHYISVQPLKRQQIVLKALSYNGLKEVSPNRHRIIDGMMIPAGDWAIGSPWCIGFVSHVLQACGADWPVYHVSTEAMIDWARREGRITKNPKPGDVGCFLYPPKPNQKHRPGHGFFGLGFNENYCMDIDGNCGDSVKVGYRALQGLTWIETVRDESPQSFVPPGLERLDGWKDR